MKEMRQALIGILAAATWSATLPVYGQSTVRPCTDPGWLYVTAVAARGANLQTGETQPLTQMYNAPRLLNRCEIDGVYQATLAESFRVRAQLDGAVPDRPRELTRINVMDRSQTYLTELFVEESVAEICRALPPDCVFPVISGATGPAMRELEGGAAQRLLDREDIDRDAFPR